VIGVFKYFLESFGGGAPVVVVARERVIFFETKIPPPHPPPPPFCPFSANVKITVSQYVKQESKHKEE